jgi:Fanconi anemia group M protein
MKQIFDIFSRKKQRILLKPKIIVDYREKGSLVLTELMTLNIEVEVKELKVADYIVAGVAVERKTVSDFINSMKSGRLLSQLEEIKQYESRLLVIEGIEEQDLYSDNFSEEKIGMHPNSVRGFLLSILLNHRVPIIFTKNHEDTARFLSVLARKKEKEAPLNPSKKFHNPEEQARYVLESFPGIGPKTSKKLLRKFKTIKNVISASEEELKEVLGKKTLLFLKIIEKKF